MLFPPWNSLRFKPSHLKVVHSYTWPPGSTFHVTSMLTAGVTFTREKKVSHVSVLISLANLYRLKKHSHSYKWHISHNHAVVEEINDPKYITVNNTMSTKIDINIHVIRRHVLFLCARTGSIAEGMVIKPLAERRMLLPMHVGDIMSATINAAVATGIDLFRASLRKIDLNAEKYPVRHCRNHVRKHRITFCAQHFINIV